MEGRDRKGRIKRSNVFIELSRLIRRALNEAFSFRGERINSRRICRCRQTTDPATKTRSYLPLRARSRDAASDSDTRTGRAKS